MRPEDILDMLRKHPFEPFRIHRSDGVAFDVRHPDMAICNDRGSLSPSPAPKGPTARPSEPSTAR
jgi:hypothetical protein